MSDRPILDEIATTQDGRDITRGWVDRLAALQPQDSILARQGSANYDLYRQVLSDSQVFSTFQQRRMALLETEWEVIPGGKRAVDKSAADFVQEQLDQIGWDRINGLMHYGVFYGFAVAECLWAYDGRFVGLDALKVRDRQRFAFNGEMQLCLKTNTNTWPGELMPDKKFWQWQTGADHQDDPYGIGLAHWCYWPVLFKRQNIRFWLINLEKFASPTAVGWFPPQMGGDSAAAKSERSKLLAALRAIQLDSGVILPEGVRAELLQAQRSGAGDYAQLCEYMDQAIAKVTIGQVMTSQAVGGQYKADVQQAVLEDIVASDADLLCESFNRTVVRWLIDWNFQAAAPPKVWRRTEADEDLTTRADRESKIFTMGYRPTLAQIIDTYGGDWEPAPAASAPNAGNSSIPLLEQGGVARSAGVVPTGQPPTFAEANTPPSQPPAVILTDQLQEKAADPWKDILDQVRAVVDHAESLEMLRDDLLNLYGQLDSAKLVQVMQLAFAAADLSGRYDVNNGH